MYEYFPLDKKRVIGRGNGHSPFSIFSMVPFGVPSCSIPVVQHSLGSREAISKETEGKHSKNCWFNRVELEGHMLCTYILSLHYSSSLWFYTSCLVSVNLRKTPRKTRDACEPLELLINADRLLTF